MKAIVQTAYGAPDEVLELRDIDRPPSATIRCSSAWPPPPSPATTGT